MTDLLGYSNTSDQKFAFRPLASVADLRTRWPALCNGKSDETLYAALVDATREIEDRTSRRLAPFTGHLDELGMTGINPNEFGGGTNMPTSIQGALGMSYASSLGINSLIRRFWLNEYAPRYPEMWEYEILEMRVLTTYGSWQDVSVANGDVIDIEKTTGFTWLQIGLFAPEESRIRICYNGGYVNDTPGSLQRACLLQAVEFLIMEGEPQQRKDMSVDELERQITKLVAPWVKG